VDAITDDAAATLARLIAEATEALSHLDAEALEELGRHAEALAGLDLGNAGVTSRAMVPVLEHRFRLFAALLKATGDNLATLRRAEARKSPDGPPFGDPRLRGQDLWPDESLRVNGYERGRGVPPRGLFESFGLYSEEEADDSIWPRGRMAQARERRKAASPAAKSASDEVPGRV
jgi:hypothetical protein